MDCDDFAAVSAFSSITHFFPNTSFMNTHSHIYNIFSCHSGKHGAGNMNRRLNSKRQLAHRLFQEIFFFLYLETQGIYIWGLGCIWKESFLQNLSLEIKRVDRHNNFSKSAFMDLISSSALEWQTALFGGAGLDLGYSTEPWVFSGYRSSRG